MPTLEAQEQQSQGQRVHQPEMILEELSSDSNAEGDKEDDENWEDEQSSQSVDMSTTLSEYLIPSLFTTPPLTDPLMTETSIVQEETVEEVIPFLTATSGRFSARQDLSISSPYNAFGIPFLSREKHIAFLHKCLEELPAAYIAADASRPWFFYWVLCALRTLGQDVSVYESRLVSSVRSAQNLTGGFAGGHGQMSHLAPSYAVILSLAIVGGKEAMECVDRKAMWHWLGQIKSSDGGFAMSIGGEEDVRGAYCATVILCLLDLPLELPPDSPFKSRQGSRDTDTLLTGLAEYVGRCQTFEGGISGCPDAEAHGAYAFCALGCLSILGSPHEIIPKYLDIPLLVSWLSARQHAPEGGFAGRSNKLVDGCYSHWVGGCWPLIEAVLDRPASSTVIDPDTERTTTEHWDPSLYSREGLIRYILCCCQDTSRRGGLRDKPSKYSDAYHTCYVLSGLSAAQNAWSYMASNDSYEAAGAGNNLTAPCHWVPTQNPRYEDSESGTQVFDEIDRVCTVHPVFVVPEGTAEKMRGYYLAKEGF